MNINSIFIVCALIMSAIGAYCAYKLNADHPLVIRLIVMAPAIMGLFAPVLIYRGSYIPYEFDVIFMVVVILLYALVASRFSSTPWLDLRTKKG